MTTSSQQPSKQNFSSEPSLFDTFSESTFSDKTQKSLQTLDSNFKSHLCNLRKLNQDITPEIRAKAILESVKGIQDGEASMAALLAYISVYNPTFDVKQLAKPAKTAFSEITIEGDTQLAKQFEFSDDLQKELHYLLDQNQEFMLLPKEKRDSINRKIQHNFVFISPGKKQSLNEKPHEMKNILRPYTEFYLQKFMYSSVIALNLDNDIFLSCESANHAVRMGLMAALCKTTFEEMKISFNRTHKLFDVENIFAAFHYMCQQTFAVKQSDHVNLLIVLFGLDAFKQCYGEQDAWMDPLFELASRSIVDHEKVDICLSCIGSEKLYKSVDWEKDGFACENFVVPLKAIKE
mmetsp:Transcript_10676/g.39885  ORF Transcript_10676/g.39885 Transcript_10676/m.39885 type:complete len:349 (+) Transcript_10676:28-1074(+)